MRGGINLDDLETEDGLEEDDSSIAKKPPPAKRLEEGDRKKAFLDWWEKAEIIPIAMFVIMIDVILFTTYPTLVWEPVTRNWKYVVMLHVFYCVALTVATTTPKWKVRVARILAVAAILALTTNVLGVTPWISESYWANPDSKPAPQGAGVATTSSSTRPPEADAVSPIKLVEMETVRFFTSPQSGLSKEDALKLIAIAKLESGFHQFEADGKTVYRGRFNPSDVCVMQINEEEHSAEIKKLGFKIYELQGCLEMALWLYKKYDIKPWNTKENAKRLLEKNLEKEVTAPVGGWSDPFQIPDYCRGEPGANVWVRDSYGNVYFLDISKELPSFLTKTFEYKAPGDTPVKVKIRCPLNTAASLSNLESTRSFFIQKLLTFGELFLIILCIFEPLEGRWIYRTLLEQNV